MQKPCPLESVEISRLSIFLLTSDVSELSTFYPQNRIDAVQFCIWGTDI